MNKKFSTLVAGLLLASSVGTVGAVTPDYSKFTAAGTLATNLKQNGAFQLADSEGNVLAMVKEADGKLVLKMVAANTGANLAETLWTIRWTTYDDTVKKYYFTFESAAYHMPLSFSTENAGNGDLTSEINYEFPGKIGTWEWQEGIEGKGINGEAALKYRFANPDSVMTLAVNNGEVGAIKYAQSKGDGGKALTLKPMVVQGTVLTADDLNSTMLSNTKAGKFRLGFFGDVVGSKIGNMWTANDLIAEPVVAYSTSMYKKGNVPAEDTYNANQKAAAQAAKDAADKLLAPATVENAVQTAITAGSAWDQAAKDWAATVKAAATTTENTFDASLNAVNAEVAKKDGEVKEAAALAAAASAINTVVAAYEMDEIVGENNDKATVDGVIAAVSLTDVDAVKDDLVTLFKGKVEDIDNNEELFDASKAAVAALNAKFDVTVPDYVAADNDKIKEWVKANVDAEVEALVTSMVGSETVVATVNTNIAKLTTAAGLINTAVDNLSFTAHVDAWDLAKFKEEYAKLAYGQVEAYTADQYTEVKDAIKALIDELPITVDAADRAKSLVADQKTKYEAASTAAEVYADAVTGIKNALTAMNSAQAVKDAIDACKEDFNKEGDDIIVEISSAVKGENLPAAVASVNIEKYLAAGSQEGEVVDQDVVSKYVSLYLGKKDSKENKLYLAVDTNLLTGVSGNRHLKFDAWKYTEGITNSNGKLLSETNVPLFRDYNGHFNFKFTYYPTEDSLKIETDGYAMKPAVGVENWVDITDVNAAHGYEANGKFVKLAVLADNHKEVTVGKYEQITGSELTTINTRIGFGINFKDYAAIPAGVYTIKYVSNEEKNANRNGRYITYNWLYNNYQVMASVEDQELNHIPAAQWIVTQAKGEKLNSIVNRESNKALVYTNEFGQVQQQYMYATSTANLYTNMEGDSLLFTSVPKEFTTDKTLGYFIDPEKNLEADDQLRVFSLNYLNNLNNDLFVGYNDADSILNVAKTEDADRIYFRLIRATDSIAYGPAEVKDIATQLKRIPYYLQLETANKNIKDEDKLFITLDKDGKFKLINSTLTNGKVNYANLDAFFLKEFKEADAQHYYAIIKAQQNEKNEITGALGSKKISVKDYPSILVQEDLEGENQSEDYSIYNWGYLNDGRTSTFGLVAKDAPKYRRLGVTDAEDGLNNMGTNVAKINLTREDNRYLYENTANRVAGYESDPTGINYLGALFNGENKAAMFIDTAYVRNETARPQYLLAVRPDFTPDTTFCPIDHGHPYELVDQVRANYLVTLSDSVAAYKGDKKMLDKFMYENRTYTRLAFVDAVHQGDTLLIMSSKFKGTKLAANDTIDLSKNEFNNAAVQFRLTKNDDQKAEFYIETQNNEFVRLINGVAVLTNDIADAERFNIAKTDDKPVANDEINAAEVSVIATEGAVIVKGAAGKNVVVTNVLGQTIANTVITSSEAQISAPAGIVVVAVEGEAAVKAIVK
ncbi:DUF6383 domain-containing protein [Parabacteroides chongii]|uniref:DUF6383 domain-containing protein n=1 Tax=Parabacteroides chongii TaxID=2685834 RepID=UPI00240DF5CA|nr:DUF6383 domain-containing protein [Parabacteroides chongii]WFE85402.1 DUF6383 domain-containing protein [Parabacteroides chongii]